MPTRFPLHTVRTLFIGACMTVAAVAHANDDAAFLAARDAFSAGNRQAFERYATGLQSHPLASYIDYYRLRMDIDRASPDSIAVFLERNADTVIA